MAREIAERDWKVFRELRAVALERFCERTISEIERLAADSKKSWHDRYLAIYKKLDRRDEELANAFNDARRSTAFLRLAQIRGLGLLSDEEMARFGQETQSVVRHLLS